MLDAWSRRIVGWSIADHIRAELVADAVQMATWRRRPPKGQTVAHSDHGSVYTSWLFGNRLRTAGLLDASVVLLGFASVGFWLKSSSAVTGGSGSPDVGPNPYVKP